MHDVHKVSLGRNPMVKKNQFVQRLAEKKAVSKRNEWVRLNL